MEQDDPGEEASIARPILNVNGILIRPRRSSILERFGGIWFCSMIILSLGFLGLLLWVAFVYRRHAEETCDQPIAGMLNLLVLLLVLNCCQSQIIRCAFCLCNNRGSEPLCAVGCRWALAISLLLWPMAAGIMLARVRECPDEVVMALSVLLSYFCVFVVAAICLPVCFITMLLRHLRRGVVQLPDIAEGERGVALAADVVEQLPKMPFEAMFLDASGDVQCPICFEDFDADRPISQTRCTPSAHTFHTECLLSWTRHARTCPLCREDLDPGEVPHRVASVELADV